MRRPRIQAQCHCGAYRFPHRAGGGKCSANARSPEGLLCSECGSPAEAITVDFGIGAYEYWGCHGVHRDERSVSPCCDAGLIENRLGAYQPAPRPQPFSRLLTTTGAHQ